MPYHACDDVTQACSRVELHAHEPRAPHPHPLRSLPPHPPPPPPIYRSLAVLVLALAADDAAAAGGGVGKDAVLRSMATQLRLGERGRHLFLCSDQTKAKCCSREEGLAAWDYLKKRSRDLGLEGGDAPFWRTKANCLRVCAVGPVAVVYPDQASMACMGGGAHAQRAWQDMDGGMVLPLNPLPACLPERAAAVG